MFPLGTVLLPGMLLPLHVFEPRYRALAKHVVHGSGDGVFGVTLIERGSEVGGGDARVDVGVLARVAQANEFDDGRWSLLAVGETRIRVDEWLADDPYPRAHVTEWPDESADDAPIAPSPVLETMEEIAELARRLGHVVDDDLLAVDDDPVVATWQLVSRSPLGAADRQALLACASHDERVHRATEMLAEQRALLAAMARQADQG
jgi:Lon protease-like protein